MLQIVRLLLNVLVLEPSYGFSISCWQHHSFAMLTCERVGRLNGPSEGILGGCSYLHPVSAPCQPAISQEPLERRT